jgi:AcrR family transcriptional regulator
MEGDERGWTRARGDETRRRLVSSAEQLFSEHGVDGVSLRAINAAADVGPAAVHYHFGSKQGLVEGPYVELLASQPVGGLRWIKLVAQLALADDGLIGRVAAEIEPVLFEQVMRAFPHVDRRILAMRWALTAQTLIQMLSQLDRWHREGEEDGTHYSGYVEELVAFAAGGLSAVRADTLRRSVRLVPQPPGQ